MITINPHELIQENCTVERGPEGITIWCSYDKGYAVTPQIFKAPIVIEAEVTTDSTNIRLLYDYGQLIFNWESNEAELRWNDPGTGQGAAVPGAGKVPINTWITISWTIQETFAAVSVDGEERFRVPGDFREVSGQIGIGSAMGSTVRLRKLTVDGTPSDKGTLIPEVLEIKDSLDRSVKLMVDCADLSGSHFVMVKGEPLSFKDVTLVGTSITDADLGRLEIIRANLGGAYLRHIGAHYALSPDHPAYNPDAKMEPIRFEQCDFNHSVMTDCDLSHMELVNCQISGLTINGYSIEQLINEYVDKKQAKSESRA